MRKELFSRRRINRIRIDNSSEAPKANYDAEVFQQQHCFEAFAKRWRRQHGRFLGWPLPPSHGKSGGVARDWASGTERSYYYYLELWLRHCELCR